MISQFFCVCWDLLFILMYYQLCTMFYGLWRGGCRLCCLGGMICRCQLNLFYLWCLLTPLFPFSFISSLYALSRLWWEWGTKITVYLYIRICLFFQSNVSLMKQSIHTGFLNCEMRAIVVGKAKWEPLEFTLSRKKWTKNSTTTLWWFAEISATIKD